MKVLAALILAGLLPVSAADYGEKVRFAPGRPLKFPDCELVFTGTRTVSTPQYPRGFLFYDFEARAGGKTQKVSWTSGTGVIDPADFQVDGKKFVLELKGSEGFKGWLKDNELVLWRAESFPPKRR